MYKHTYKFINKQTNKKKKITSTLLKKNKQINNEE